MGIRYVGFRILFELKKRLGLLKKAFPVHPKMVQYVLLASWKKDTVFLIPAATEWKNKPYPFRADSDKTAKMQKGIFEFFSSTEYNLGVDYDWVTNPDTGFKYDVHKHWTEINDYAATAGDIKYAWEKSRFSFVYAFIRQDIAEGTDHAAFVFGEIESWIDANPINQGPNYKCSQETSLRLLNWTFALHFYRNSPLLTEALFDKIMHVVYWQMKHVRSNIHFSRIAVRNNHAVTETLMLYIGGLLFPFFPEAAEWKSQGKKWFEQEVRYQVYPDGTFLQFSLNYHRVLVQLLNVAFFVSDVYNESFSEVIYERAYRSLNFLLQCQAPENGMLPNYGANDGAIFFPLTSCEYRDYRPSLHTLHYLLTGEHLYANGPWREEVTFYDIRKPVRSYPALQQLQGWVSFADGGYYMLRDGETLTFIRCGNHKDRPSQADNLHIDIWVSGKNVLFDGGSYKYNTDRETLRYFMGTASHNTVMLDNNDQMLKGGRFIWYFWSQCNHAAIQETQDSFVFEGSISAFWQLDTRIRHVRKVTKLKGENTWKIRDQILNKPEGSLTRQLFHVNKHMIPEVRFQSGTSMVAEAKDAWYSGKYGSKESITQQEFQTKGETIETIIKI
jgi:hypothetical protein